MSTERDESEMPVASDPDPGGARALGPPLGGIGEGVESKATPHDDRERANRIPIWVVEEDVGDGLPTERTYSHSSLGPPIGYVVMPAGMHADRYADHIRFDMDPQKPGAYSVLVASLSTRRAVEAAIGGEFGLSWRPGESSAPVSPDRADAHLWAANERLEAERDKLRAELDALMALIVQPWARDGDGAQLWKVNLAWWETATSREEGVAMVRKAAGLEAKP
jgi:hypothetical protein